MRGQIKEKTIVVNAHSVLPVVTYFLAPPATLAIASLLLNWYFVTLSHSPGFFNFLRDGYSPSLLQGALVLFYPTLLRSIYRYYCSATFL
jgi:hypothetical protein